MYQILLFCIFLAMLAGVGMQWHLGKYGYKRDKHLSKQDKKFQRSDEINEILRSHLQHLMPLMASPCFPGHRPVIFGGMMGGGYGGPRFIPAPDPNPWVQAPPHYPDMEPSKRALARALRYVFRLKNDYPEEYQALLNALLPETKPSDGGSVTINGGAGGMPQEAGGIRIKVACESCGEPRSQPRAIPKIEGGFTAKNLCYSCAEKEHAIVNLYE